MFFYMFSFGGSVWGIQKSIGFALRRATRRFVLERFVSEMTVCVTFGALRLGTHFRMLLRCEQICNDLYGLAHTCPPDHTVRSVWRAPALGSVEPLAWPLGVWAGKADQDFLTGSG